MISEWYFVIFGLMPINDCSRAISTKCWPRAAAPLNYWYSGLPVSAEATSLGIEFIFIFRSPVHRFWVLAPCVLKLFLFLRLLWWICLYACFWLNWWGCNETSSERWRTWKTSTHPFGVPYLKIYFCLFICRSCDTLSGERPHMLFIKLINIHHSINRGPRWLLLTSPCWIVIYLSFVSALWRRGTLKKSHSSIISLIISVYCTWLISLCLAFDSHDPSIVVHVCHLSRFIEFRPFNEKL